jgi:hypothetical protein
MCPWYWKKGVPDAVFFCTSFVFCNINSHCFPGRIRILLQVLEAMHKQMASCSPFAGCVQHEFTWRRTVNQQLLTLFSCGGRSTATRLSVRRRPRRVALPAYHLVVSEFASKTMLVDCVVRALGRGVSKGSGGLSFPV